MQVEFKMPKWHHKNKKERECLLKLTRFTPTIKKYFVSSKIVCIFALQKRSNKATVFAVETDNT